MAESYVPQTDDPFAGAGTDPDDANQGALTGTEGQLDEASAGGTDD